MDYNFFSIANMASLAVTVVTNIVIIAMLLRVWRVVHHQGLLLIGIGSVLFLSVQVLSTVGQFIGVFLGFQTPFLIITFVSIAAWIVFTAGIVKVLRWIPELLELRALDMSGAPDSKK